MRPLVECRVPAYDRPELLERALRSLQAQTFSDWGAIVFDDSRSQSGRAVVDALGDSRVSYRHNPERLGSTGNLNQAFSPQPLAGGEFAFILEDDNAVTPDFISTALRRIGEGGLDVISLNQKCVLADGEGGFVVQPGAGRPEDMDTVWSDERLILSTFLKPGLPNGGYFWRCNTVDLRVDERIREPMLQEGARQLRVGDDILLAKEACSLWSALPPDLVRRDKVKNRVFLLTRDLFAAAVLKCVPAKTVLRWGKAKLDAAQLHMLRDRLGGVALFRPQLLPLFANNPREACKGLVRNLLYRSHVPRDLSGLLQDEPENLFGSKYREERMPAKSR
jgi:glycosyltransferase involved in cell wall biosynthesis